MFFKTSSAKSLVASIAASLITLGIAQPVNAKWQFTEWGMTPDQVSKLSKGKAPRSSGNPGMQIVGKTVGNVGEQQSGVHNFQSVFYYENSKLWKVLLKKTDGFGCDSLKKDLLSRYGKTFSTIDGPIAVVVWHDRKNNNRIELIRFDDSNCSIDYRALISSDSKGL